MGPQEALSAFLVFSVIVTVSPGPDTVLVLRNGLSQGRRSALAISAGAATGSLAWGVAAALGVAALLQRSDVAFNTLRWVGAAYLAYLGVRTLLERGSVLGPESAQNASGPAEEKRVPRQGSATITAFRQGLLSDLLSPKAGLFFLAVLPQFVPHGWKPLPAMLLLSAFDSLLVLVWLGLLSCMTHYAMRWLRHPRWNRAVQWVCGLTLVVLGLQVALTTSN